MRRINNTMRAAFPQKPLPFKTIGSLLLIGISIVLIYLLWGPTANESMQAVTLAELKGVWRSPQPAYKDRFLQFDDQTITFGWGADGSGSYTIAAIDSQPDDAGTLVRVRYHDLADTVYQFQFLYVDRVGGLLRIKNQKGVDWYHTNDQPIHFTNYQ